MNIQCAICVNSFANNNNSDSDNNNNQVTAKRPNIKISQEQGFI